MQTIMTKRSSCLYVLPKWVLTPVAGSNDCRRRLTFGIDIMGIGQGIGVCLGEVNGFVLRG